MSYPSCIQIFQQDLLEQVGNELTIDVLIDYLNSKGRMGFYITGEFVHPSNRLNLCSLLVSKGMHRQKTLNSGVGVVVYTSDKEGLPHNKLATAEDYKVPVIANEAGFMRMAGLYFKARDPAVVTAVIETKVTPAEWHRNRAPGMTTRLALQYLVAALNQEHCAIQVEDHAPGRPAAYECLMIARDLANKMGLRGLRFDPSNMTVTYDGKF